MPGTRVVRPIVRSFRSPFSREAAAHVRAGGHAVVWEAERRASLVLPIPDRANLVGDLAYWSLLDLGKERWKEPKEGPFKGLATALVPSDCLELVRRRAERDSAWPGTTRTIRFDCLACGACCSDNRVVLDDDDVARFKNGGRPELVKPPFTKRENGTLVLRLLRDKRCRHLELDNKCAVYALRPAACSTFPVASECCLFAREDGLGLLDGTRD